MGTERALDRRRLLHDVAKYIVRTSQNVPADAPLPAPLLPLLIADLYGEDAPSPRAAYRTLGSALTGAERGTVDGLWARLDALEDGVRAGEAEATAKAMAVATEIAGTLHRWIGAGDSP